MKLGSFLKGRLSGAVTVLCVFVFSISIILFLCGQILTIRNDDARTVFTDEINTPETVYTVFRAEDSGMLYVCYQNGAYVNVYDKTGNFLYALSIPYKLKGIADFMLDGDRLFISFGDTYIYDASTGSLIETIPDKDLWDLTENYNQVGEGEGEGYAFDLLNVYVIDANGARTPVVSKSVFTLLFYAPFDFLFAILAVLVLGAAKLISSVAERRRVAGKAQSKAAKILVTAYGISALLCALFAVADIVAAKSGFPIMIGIIPLGIAFIGFNIYALNKTDRGFDNDGDGIIVSMWQKLQYAAFLAAFFSVIIALGLSV